jgi:hypothetical protein
MMMGDEVGRACNMHGMNERFIQNLDQKRLKGRDHQEDLDIDIRITFKWVLWE